MKDSLQLRQEQLKTCRKNKAKELLERPKWIAALSIPIQESRPQECTDELVAESLEANPKAQSGASTASSHDQDKFIPRAESAKASGTRWRFSEVLRGTWGKVFGLKGAARVCSEQMSPKNPDGTASPHPSAPVEGPEIPELMARQPAKANIVPNMVSIGVQAQLPDTCEAADEEATTSQTAASTRPLFHNIWSMILWFKRLKHKWEWFFFTLFIILVLGVGTIGAYLSYIEAVHAILDEAVYMVPLMVERGMSDLEVRRYLLRGLAAAGVLGL